MRTVLPIIFSLVLVAGFVFLTRLLLRSANRKVWKNSFIDKTAKALPWLALVLWLLLGVSYLFKLIALIPFAFALLAALLIISFSLNLTLPFTFLTDLINKKFIFRKAQKPALNESRRLFLKTTAASLPMFTVACSASGFAQAFTSVRFPKIDFTYDDLPDELNGLRIWHLSDLHLGYYTNLADLELMLRAIEKEPLDLILLTGDVADDLSQLTDALRLIDQVKTPYPKFMSIGNHEYFRGIQEVRKRIDASAVQLLMDNGASIRIGNQDVLIGGANDPVYMHSNILPFLEKTTARALEHANADSFKILLSHRPRALDVAEPFGIDLILAGHTHGGQIGLNGRSLFEDMADESYLWGKYRKGKSQLYTSAGAGHWFPFRLGCPAEAPIITLKKV